MTNEFVLCCDWGTSSFRLRLVDSSANTLSELTNNDGNARIFNEWSQDTTSDRVACWFNYLERAVDKLAGSTGKDLHEIPVVISGMASSSVGIKELPYSTLPFTVEGTNATAEWLCDKSILNNPVLLVSGIRHSADVVRGEETELIGLIALTDAATKESIYIFPGTHSKHLVVENNTVVNSETYMTGELFALLKQYSLLSKSVAIPQQVSLLENNLVAFREGVQEGIKSTLLNSLFTVRVNGIDNRFSKEQNYYYLSGLLIGSELKNLEGTSGQVILCCQGKLKLFYETALSQILDAERCVIIPVSIMNKATNAGQLKILNHNMAAKP